MFAVIAVNSLLDFSCSFFALLDFLRSYFHACTFSLLVHWHGHVYEQVHEHIHEHAHIPLHVHKHVRMDMDYMNWKINCFIASKCRFDQITVIGLLHQNHRFRCFITLSLNKLLVWINLLFHCLRVMKSEKGFVDSSL